MKNLNFLILEDELIIYMHISQSLKKFGIKNIHIARSSKEALEIASLNKIDILFSDIKIKGSVDGIETSKILQSLYNIPVIFITAHCEEDTLERASGVDFIGYLLKPYREDELETLIKLAISRFSIRNFNNISYGSYIFDKKNNSLLKDGENILLSKKEKLFISLLFYNLNRIISYEIIDTTVWQDEMVSDNTRRTFLYRLKNKFQDIDIKIEKNIGIGLFVS